MDTELKEYLESMKQELKSEMGTRMDLLQGEMKGFREELRQTKTELKKDIEGLKAGQEGIIEDIERLKAGQEGIKEDIKNTEKAITIIVTATAQDVKEINQNIEGIKDDINALDARANATDERIFTQGRKIKRLQQPSEM